MKKSLLIVHQRQFGHHTGSLQYCQQLKNDFDITFLCWDYKREKNQEPGITVHYLSREGNIVIRNFRFINGIIEQIVKQKFDLIFIHYFRGCSLIPILSKTSQKFHLDIRTGSISPVKLNRLIYNSILWLESKFFKNISIISEGLRKHLMVKKNAYILPLGANPVNIKRKGFEGLNLLYVGTLSNRNLEITINGLYIFLTQNLNTKISYTIVGDGNNDERYILQQLVNKLELDKIVNLTGYVPYNDLIPFYESSNIGISFVPIKPYYEFQPVTKTFEYLMAGMPVIATGTFENKKIINDRNGYIIADNPESFAKALKLIYAEINNFDHQFIKESVTAYHWESIVAKLKEYIISIS